MANYVTLTPEQYANGEHLLALLRGQRIEVVSGGVPDRPVARYHPFGTDGWIDCDPPAQPTDDEVEDAAKVFVSHICPRWRYKRIIVRRGEDCHRCGWIAPKD